MSYAPISRLVNNPGEAGTVLQVLPDTGDRYPVAPFTGLVFTTQTIPTLGTDSEEVTILTVTNDVLTCERSDDPIALTADMQLAALYTTTVYGRDESVTLSKEFPDTDTGVALHLRTPGGAVSTPALVESAASGGSIYTRSFSADESGQWYYRFVSDQRTFAEDDFFVRFSEVY